MAKTAAEKQRGYRERRRNGNGNGNGNGVADHNVTPVTVTEVTRYGTVTDIEACIARIEMKVDRILALLEKTPDDVTARLGDMILEYVRSGHGCGREEEPVGAASLHTEKRAAYSSIGGKDGKPPALLPRRG